MLGDSNAKEVELPAGKSDLKIGDEVQVRINPSSGYKAVAFLYLLPFLLMVCSLLLLLRIGYSEGTSGLISLLVLIPYFGIIFLFRKQLGSQCRIDVVKNEFSHPLYNH